MIIIFPCSKLRLFYYITDDVTPLVDEDEVRVSFCHENAIQTRNVNEITK